MKGFSRLQDNRKPQVFVCHICGKVITGKVNTIAMGILAHTRKEIRLGLRREEYSHRDGFGCTVEEAKNFIAPIRNA